MMSSSVLFIKLNLKLHRLWTVISTGTAQHNMLRNAVMKSAGRSPMATDNGSEVGSPGSVRSGRSGSVRSRSESMADEGEVLHQI